MKKYWNRDSLKKQYLRIYNDAKQDGYSDDELTNPYLDKLSHQTKSARIMKMVKLSYYLGWLRGIAYIDDGFTPVSIRDIETFGEF